MNAPHAVETVVRRDKQRNRLLVHFLNFSAPATATSAPFDKGRQVFPPTMEEPSEYVATPKVKPTFSRAGAVSSTSRLEIRGPQIRFSSDQIHEVIEIQLS